MLQKGSGANVTGYVELESSLVFTGHHTVDTTVAGAATVLVCGAASERHLRKWRPHCFRSESHVTDRRSRRGESRGRATPAQRPA